MTGTTAGTSGPMRPGRQTRAGWTLVVGLGSPDRGDDAIGGEVARCVAALALPRVDVMAHEDPTDLIELWADYDAVVVVDAVSSGAPAGQVRVLEIGAGLDPLPESAWARTGRGGTHAFGLAEAVGLARALRRLPARVSVVGVEAGGFDHGAPLSTELAAAVPAVAGVVAKVIARHRSDASPLGTEGDHVPR